MLDFDQTLASSHLTGGALGAIAFAILVGLREGGADDAAVSTVNALMQKHMAELTDEDCNTLCAVVSARLKSDVQPDGRWY